MDVFVYGTLTSPDRVREVLESFVFVGPAVLSGLHAVAGEYPTLAPGGEVGSRVLRTDEVAALDAYEGVDRGLYVRETVPATGDRFGDAVAVYVGDPDALGADAEWPGEGDFAGRVRRYLDGHRVVVSARTEGTGIAP
ncbi:MAG: gamma-glutamylcyclotransferase [Haloferacaceae archaeon]